MENIYEPVCPFNIEDSLCVMPTGALAFASNSAMAGMGAKGKKKRSPAPKALYTKGKKMARGEGIPTQEVTDGLYSTGGDGGALSEPQTLRDFSFGIRRPPPKYRAMKSRR